MTLTQKVLSTAVLGVAMLAMALAMPHAAAAQTTLPPGTVAQPTSGVRPVDTQTLGLDYGDYTGLGKQPVQVTIARIINVALGLLGIIAVVIILIGGFKWMTAGGNETGAEEAKKIITSGVIGLAIILSAYAIARFVLGSLTSATTGVGV